MSTAHSAAQAAQISERAGAADRVGRFAPPQRRLAVVPPLPVQVRPAPGRAPFVLLVCSLLACGLLSLLLLNTVLAQGSFAVYNLEKRSSELADQESALREGLAREAAPAQLARRAEELGMVPSENPAFLRVPDGAVLGVPAPGKARPKAEEPQQKTPGAQQARTTEKAEEAKKPEKPEKPAKPADGAAARVEARARTGATGNTGR